MTGIAAREDNSTTVEIMLNSGLSAVKSRIVVGGEELRFNDAGWYRQEFKGET